VIRIHRRVVALAIGCIAFPGWAATCPDKAGAAAVQAHPGGKIVSCKPAKEDGRSFYEIKLTLANDQRIELDVTDEGEILVTEEEIPPADVPEAVRAAFTAKYPGATIAKATKESAADGQVSYELRFGQREATFSSDGTFREVE